MNAQALELSDNAANKVRQLRESEGNNDLMLRVYVTGGGCSGFSYGFNFAESVNEDDAEFSNGDVKMLVDSLSYQYLVGSVVDYLEGLEVINTGQYQVRCRELEERLAVSRRHLPFLRERIQKL